jgi:hypothetical protein
MMINIFAQHDKIITEYDELIINSMFDIVLSYANLLHSPSIQSISFQKEG